jgi:hypothetical protein
VKRLLWRLCGAFGHRLRHEAIIPAQTVETEQGPWKVNARLVCQRCGGVSYFEGGPVG